MNATLPALTSFILPGGTDAAAFAHMARVAARRAERAVVAVDEDDFELEHAPARVTARTAGMARRSKRGNRNMGSVSLLCDGGSLCNESAARSPVSANDTPLGHGRT